MADYEINVSEALLSNLMTEQHGLAQLLESVLNQILEAQASEQIGAERYERSEARTAYRNGMRMRQRLFKSRNSGTDRFQRRFFLDTSARSRPSCWR